MFANKGKNPFLLCMYFVYCDAEAEIYKWLREFTKTSLDNCFKKVIRKVLDWKVSNQTATYTKYVEKKHILCALCKEEKQAFLPCFCCISFMPWIN